MLLTEGILLDFFSFGEGALLVDYFRLIRILLVFFFMELFPDTIVCIFFY